MKNNDRYWNGAKIHNQVVKKALPIIKVFYSGYLLCFLFNNITSHSVYTKNTYQVKEMNKWVDEK